MSAIKAGDLVMIAKASKCCGNTEKIGTIFTVKQVIKKDRGFCVRCGKGYRNELVAIFDYLFPVYLHRLIKIDPPALLETITEREELTA